MSKVYIGQTGHLLQTRIEEHKTAVKYAKCDVSAVSEHVWERNHHVDFQSVSFLACDCNLNQCLSPESLFNPLLLTGKEGHYCQLTIVVSVFFFVFIGLRI